MIRRTDLAVEHIEMLNEAAENGKVGEIPGVSTEHEEYGEEVSVTRIKIENEEGSRAMEKPQGNYITLEIRDGVDGSEEMRDIVSHALAVELSRLIPFHYYLKVLVVGLGNEKVTPDSLGPHTVSKVHVTRHLFVCYNVDGDEDEANVSALSPGVMALTGMESMDIIRHAAEITQPEVVLVVDSLAARNIERINTTIQITDTGISPGSGMQNYRKELTEQSLGRRVVAVGVPTVIDAASLVLDTMAGYLAEPEKAEHAVNEAGLSMIVTSSEIDQVIHDFSSIIAHGINIALHPGIYS